MNCLNCQKEIKQTKGKREKKYCSDSCRVTYFQKSKKKDGVSSKYVLRESYERLFEQNQEILRIMADLEAENKALKEAIAAKSTEPPLKSPQISIAPRQRKVVDARNLAKKNDNAVVSVQNLAEPPKTNYSINTTGKPERREGEDSLDYAFRVNEWKKTLKNQ